jgi:DNA polymerase III delta prime subunit
LNEPEPLQLAKFMENYDQDKLAELMARYGLSESDVLKDERWQFALKKELDDAEYVSQLKKQIPPAIPEQQQKYLRNKFTKATRRISA